MIISKNTKMFLIIFSIILLIITIVAIIYTNTHKNSNESQVIIENIERVPLEVITTSEQNVDDVEGTSLDDTYSNNGLECTYISDIQNNVNIYYPQISGLKDHSVEESINNQIRERINKILDSNNFKNNSDESADVKAYVTANFADVLSVKISVKFNKNFGKCYGVSYKLDSGERIKISELFTGEAPKKNIITLSAYKTFAISYYTEEGLSNDFYNNIESDILNFLIDYNNDKVTEFSFTPMYIELYREGKTVKINMKDYPQYIAIYNRFKVEENLYESTENVIYDIPVFSKRPDSIIDLYDKVSKNCIIDVCIMKSDKEVTDFSEKELSVIQSYKEDLESRLKEIKNERGIYYSNYVYVSRSKEDGKDILLFSENEKYAKLEEDRFVNEIYDKIIGAERDVSNEDYKGSKIDILEKELVEKMTVEKKYDIESGEEIIKEEQVEEQTEEIEEVEEAVTQEEPENIEQPQTSPVISSEEPEVSSSPSPSTNSQPVPGNITTQVIF